MRHSRTTSFALIASLAYIGGSIACSDDKPSGPAAIVSVSLSAASTDPLGSIGDTRTITAVVKDANQGTVSSPSLTWSTSAPSVATVVGNGATATVTSVGNGTATITATSGTVQGTFAISVAQRATTLTLTGAPASVAPGATAQITTAARDANGQAITGVSGFTFTSSNQGVALVNASGLVTAIAPGSATITGSVTQSGSTVTGTTPVTVAFTPAAGFRALLNGANERPNAVTTPALGSAAFTVSGTTVSYVVAFSQLTGTPVGAHIHAPGSATQSASVVVDFPTAGLTVNNGVLTGTFNASNIRGIGGQPAFSLDSLLTLMRNGNAYVNVHTPTYGGGEIRGQVIVP